MERGWMKLLFFGTVFIIVGVTHQTGYTYYIQEYILFTDLKLSWMKAQSYCRAVHTDLATVSNEEDISRINDMNYNMSFWIGLYDDVNSWRWSLLNEHFYTEEGQDYRQWQEGQPDNAGAVERCVSMMEDGFWRDNDCVQVKMPLICFRDDTDDQYVLVTEEQSWFEAQSYCRQYHTDLVSVRSQIENQEVLSSLQGNQTVQEAWIGLHRDAWKWSDGSRSLFRQWWDLQPDNENSSQACVAMQSGRWDDWNCDTKFNFLCQNITVVTMTPLPEPTAINPAGQRRTTVKMKLLTDSDLTDPTIRQKVLQQFEAALNFQGFTDIKLHWRTIKSEPQPTEADVCGEDIK
uniref:C-type mannose receptor 2-like n=1 Tax=Epinephelus lanceolatus TaxID=310571 RepID=UPI001444E897|nr:C-type mannose receptor 2-like [Epinephelus lanceolatus]